MEKPAVILIAEDNGILQRILRLALEHEGYAVVAAMSGAELFERLAETIPDLIVLDVSLPDADGRELLAALKRAPTTTSIPVVMWSGNGGPAEQRAALELGATAFVEKGPADPLVHRIARILLRLSEQPPRIQ